MPSSPLQMHEIDARLRPFPTPDVASEVGKLQSDGERFVRFDIGEPDFETPTHIKDAAIAAVRNGYTHYTSAKGLPELTAAIANCYAAKGIPVSPENMAAFPGSKFALYAVLSLLVDQGDEGITQDPSWREVRGE
ncbi:MAG: hypothetical protein ABSC50_04325 [Candidatus Bathyarchaeia archaeon]